MPSTFSERLRLELMATGEMSDTWGIVTDTNLGTILDSSIAGAVAIAMPDANYTLTVANGAADQARFAVLVLSGSLTAARDLMIPAVQKTYTVVNTTGFAINVRISGQLAAAVAPGTTAKLWCDGVGTRHAVTGTDVLALAADPTTALQATTKQYVDATPLSKIYLVPGIYNSAGFPVSTTSNDIVAIPMPAGTQRFALQGAVRCDNQDAVSSTDVVFNISYRNAGGTELGFLAGGTVSMSTVNANRFGQGAICCANPVDIGPSDAGSYLMIMCYKTTAASPVYLYSVSAVATFIAG